MALQRWIRRLLPGTRPRRRRLLAGSRHTERLETKTLLSAFVVTTPIDLPDIAIGDGIAEAANGQTSLRAATEEANSPPGPDTIVLPPGLFELLSNTSSSPEADAADSGSLIITDDLTIIGAGSAATQIDGGNAASVYRLQDGATLSLGWLAVRNATQTSVVIDSGELLEIADASLESVLHSEADAAVGDSASDELATTPVANLNFSAELNPSSLSANQRQAELLLALFNKPQPSADRGQLLISQQPIIAQVAAPLDATLGIRNPQPNEALADSSSEAPPPPRIARSADTDKIGQQSQSNQRRKDVVNSLFESAPTDTTGEVRPAAAIATMPTESQEAESHAPVEPAAEADSPPLEEPLPLFPELDTPATERELPIIRDAAPLLPDLEPVLPKIQTNESAATPRRSTPLPATLSGLLISVLRYRSSKQLRRRSRNELRKGSSAIS